MQFYNEFNEFSDCEISCCIAFVVYSIMAINIQSNRFLDKSGPLVQH